MLIGEGVAGLHAAFDRTGPLSKLTPRAWNGTSGTSSCAEDDDICGTMAIGAGQQKGSSPVSSPVPISRRQHQPENVEIAYHLDVGPPATPSPPNCGEAAAAATTLLQARVHSRTPRQAGENWTTRQEKLGVNQQLQEGTGTSCGDAYGSVGYGVANLSNSAGRRGASYSDPSSSGGKRRYSNSDDIDEEESECNFTSDAQTKKQRLLWTEELHHRFTNAVNHLGVKNAVPKTILQMMNVEGMTRENVASHLQKYRLNLKKAAGLSSSAKPTPDELQEIQTHLLQLEAMRNTMMKYVATSQPGFGPMPPVELPPVPPLMHRYPPIVEGKAIPGMQQSNGTWLGFPTFALRADEASQGALVQEFYYRDPKPSPRPALPRTEHGRKGADVPSDRPPLQNPPLGVASAGRIVPHPRSSVGEMSGKFASQSDMAFGKDLGETLRAEESSLKLRSPGM